MMLLMIRKQNGIKGLMVNGAYGENGIYGVYDVIGENGIKGVCDKMAQLDFIVKVVWFA